VKAKTLIVFALLVVLLSLYSVAGFDMQLIDQIPIYASRENVPLAERPVLTQLKPHDHVLSLGCFDNKSDIFFQVSLLDERVGYLYDFKFSATKRLIPSFIGVKYFLRDPIASLQCLVMVPEYSADLKGQ
jgi:hypothetical protein